MNPSRIVRLTTDKGRSFIFCLLSLLLLALFFAPASAASPDIAWSKTYGGTGNAVGTAVVPVSDGYVVAGYVDTYNSGNIDVYLLKTDLNGNLLWNRTFGGSKEDIAYSVVAVSDGYVIAGSSNSFDPSMQVYLLKTDLNGNLLWQHTLGGIDSCKGYSLAAVGDGYVIAGQTTPYGWGNSGVYLLKTDLSGIMVWQKMYDANSNGAGRSVAVVSDGYVVAGMINITGKDRQVYLLKTDLSGNPAWEKTFGGTADDGAYAVMAVSDGYVVAGYTGSPGSGADDVYLLKTDLSGNRLWEKTFGGTANDVGLSDVAVSDGYIVAGNTGSYHNSDEVYLLKTDFNGNLAWDRTVGGTGEYGANSVAVARNGLVVAGYAHYPDNYNDAVFLITTGSVVSSSPGQAASAPVPSPALVPAALALLAGAMLALKCRARQ
jgi:hypothetical protein